MSAASTVAITVGDEEEGIKSTPNPASNGNKVAKSKPPRKPNDSKESLEMSSSTRTAKSTKEFRKGDIL